MSHKIEVRFMVEARVNDENILLYRDSPESHPFYSLLFTAIKGRIPADNVGVFAANVREGSTFLHGAISLVFEQLEAFLMAVNTVQGGLFLEGILRDVVRQHYGADTKIGAIDASRVLIHANTKALAAHNTDQVERISRINDDLQDTKRSLMRLIVVFGLIVLLTAAYSFRSFFNDSRQESLSLGEKLYESNIVSGNNSRESAPIINCIFDFQKFENEEDSEELDKVTIFP